jgi:hypothetical protein
LPQALTPFTVKSPDAALVAKSKVTALAVPLIVTPPPEYDHV